MRTVFDSIVISLEISFCLGYILHWRVCLGIGGLEGRKLEWYEGVRVRD